jgi:1,4-dihydroxy-2-naphthoate octaprenyltransferase
MERESLKAIFEVLKNNKTLTLTTKGEYLWSSKVYFASEGLYIYAVIENSKNFQNIIKNPKVFFVIEKGVPDLFIQGEGEVQILGKKEDRKKELSLLFQKNIELIPFVKSIPELYVIRIIPRKIYLSDFRTVFKPRKEITITDTDLKEALALDEGIPLWQRYLKATRPFAFTATVISVLLGALLAPGINILLLLLTVLGILFIHAGVNALNDLMDYKYGVDDFYVLGASRMLQDKFLTETQQRNLVVILLSAGVIIGIVLTILKGIWVLIIGIIGGFLGVFYQIKPLGFKYRALGDMAVFFAFGPLLALGSYYVQTRELSWIPFLSAIPVGLIVSAILHANNFRDLKEDIKSGYITIASLLGIKGSSYYYAGLIISAYLSVIILCISGILPWYSVIVLFSLPVAVKNIKLAFRTEYITFGMLDLFTAKLHSIFGILIILGIIIHKLTYG